MEAGASKFAVDRVKARFRLEGNPFRDTSEMANRNDELVSRRNPLHLPQSVQAIIGRKILSCLNNPMANLPSRYLPKHKSVSKQLNMYTRYSIAN